MAATGGHGFAILRSDPTGERRALVSADMATCADCVRELFDPADRRYRYPFINCTNCGPRFTIVVDIPYDRPMTTMAGFAMCADCEHEYTDPDNRRYHAQPICCPACGPRLSLLDATGARLYSGTISGKGALEQAADLLRQDKVVAVKGLGGFHLAVRASSEIAAAALRSRKHREDKPFAVMVPDTATARQLCELDDVGRHLLESPRRPIVLLRRRLGGPGSTGPSAGPGASNGSAGPHIATSVAPGNRHLGLMLPYTPVHHLLALALGEPFVLTSGNISDEPIAFLDDDAGARLGGIADAFLTHDRPIHMRTDDSVARSLRGKATLLRRSRGYVPQPLLLPEELPRPVLACGAELKNTFCLGQGPARLHIAPHRGPGKLRDTEVVHRGHQALLPPL